MLFAEKVFSRLRVLEVNHQACPGGHLRHIHQMRDDPGPDPSAP